MVLTSPAQWIKENQSKLYWYQQLSFPDLISLRRWCAFIIHNTVDSFSLQPVLGLHTTFVAHVTLPGVSRDPHTSCTGIYGAVNGWLNRVRGLQESCLLTRDKKMFSTLLKCINNPIPWTVQLKVTMTITHSHIVVVLWPQKRKWKLVSMKRAQFTLHTMDYQAAPKPQLVHKVSMQSLLQLYTEASVCFTIHIYIAFAPFKIHANNTVQNKLFLIWHCCIKNISDKQNVFWK